MKVDIKTGCLALPQHVAVFSKTTSVSRQNDSIQDERTPVSKMMRENLAYCALSTNSTTCAMKLTSRESMASRFNACMLKSAECGLVVDGNSTFAMATDSSSPAIDAQALRRLGTRAATWRLHNLSLQDLEPPAGRHQAYLGEQSQADPPA